MPVVEVTDYRPSLFLRNGHYNTIFTSLFRKVEIPAYQRTRLNTPDGDFLDVDCLHGDHKKACILLHGLEGSSDSQYMKSAGNMMAANGWDVYAVNWRGCSGEPNLKITSYHSGFTDDLAFILETYAHKYSEVQIIGYSLGANVLLKYLGEDPAAVPSNISKSFAISTPCHLSDGAKELKKKSNWLYTQNFLKTLKQKMIEKEKQFPGLVDLSKLNMVVDVWEFDEYYTGPMNGFAGAEDYYSQSMSLQFLPMIDRETHIITAIDDPFLAESSSPFAEAKKSKYVHFHPSTYGGHVGFYRQNNETWIDEMLLSLSQR